MEHRRRIKRRPVVGLLAALALVGITACGGDDDDASQPADAAETDDQDGAENGDAGDAGGGDSGDSDSGTGDGADDGGAGDAGGGDFPIPAPDGLVLDALVDAGLNLDSQRQLFYENDDRDRIIAFYDDWIDGNGEWSRTEIGTEVYYQRLDGGGISSIAITPDFDPGAQADGPVVFVLLVSDG